MGSILDVKRFSDLSGKPARHRKHRKHKSSGYSSEARRRNQNTGCLTNLLILAIAGFITMLIMHYWAWAMFIFFVGIVPILLLFFLRRVAKKSIRWIYFNWDRIKPWEWLKNRKFKDSADTVINKALKNIDSLNRHYRDETEANQQLFTSLKAFAGNMRIEYEPRYYGENIGDIKIGDIVIEGKLDLVSKTETDRLLGQIQYCCSRTPFKMRIVIYGQISKEAKARIKSSPYFPKRVYLIYLSDPKRRRRGY
jgi:ABC-type multidrug transport system fused ATPase/permease subunit